MAQFDIEDDPSRDLRIITVRGKITAAEFIEQGVENFEIEHPLRLLLWDMTDVEGFDFDSAQLRELIKAIKPLAKRRAGGRSAMVMRGDLEFGLGRVLEVFMEMDDLPLRGRVFRTRAEAERWLLGGDGEP